MASESGENVGRSDGIRDEFYEGVMNHAFVDYMMSVIVSRALPDVRDGLKPVHRRILYVMQKLGYHAGKAPNKCARIVGDTMGVYHPHGDSAIYEALVRMAQPWKQSANLIEGQGNFGNQDGDGAAAMRYTEARLTRVGHEVTSDVQGGTVDFRPNYDGKDREPVVLPARFPNILVNGGSGIAVGMASDIPTHNLAEAIDATLMLIDNPSATVDDVLAIMPGPDLPTSGIIMGRAKIREAYTTGRGSIPVVGVWKVEDMKRGRQQVVITEIPFDVLKGKLVEKIGDLVKEKRLDGVSDVRDESSSREGVRVVIELRADASPEVVMATVKKSTEFQTTLKFNATCLSSKGEPREMGVVEILTEFVKFRREVVLRRTLRSLDEARDQQIKQIAYYSAVSRMDEVVALIRASRDTDEATVKLMGLDFDVDDDLAKIIIEADPDSVPAPTFRFTEVQAAAVLSLSLSKLTGMAREKIAEDLRQIDGEIRGLIQIVENQPVLDGVVRRELEEIKAKYKRPRRTQIIAAEADDIDEECLIERKDVVVTLTKTGYVKRTEMAAYRAQRRGGKGKSGMETRDDDFVIEARVCTTRTPLLVFTSRGQAHALKAWRLPDAPANAKGRPIVNFIDQLREGEKVTALVPLPEDRNEVEDTTLVFVTSFGSVRRNNISDFLDLRKGGKIAMPLEDENGVSIGALKAVLVARKDDDILLATSSGMCIRFPVEDLRVFQSRTSPGVRGIAFKRVGDEVVDACVLPHSDAAPVEREVFLAGGSAFFRRDRDFVNESGEPKALPVSIVVDEAPEEDKPDRVLASLTIDRMDAMRGEERLLLTVTENGYGKRSSSHEYRVSGRGGSGITGAEINERTGGMVSCLIVSDGDQLMLMTDGGQAIRTQVSSLSILGRSTRGVKLLSVPDGQKIASVALVASAGTAEDMDVFPAEEGGDAAAPPAADDGMPDAVAASGE
jgi:DNA gyrase subunit A